ncbi:HdeA/HdeB family chaperone [Bosea sp. BK604]|uniref:HdeA/HdeB family chaperone n=1 Tax=Bosea sp. BK604 TaxID=2512180 RepID=UPI0010478EC6|nr:HdeA/HdeB family chaperone [Bosea sp. BK604]TCR65392.1 HdeA/HdeB family protein [Bosea sp. BK604]
MSRTLAAVSAALILAGSGMMAKAQVPLTSYVDAKGFIDVQALTCAQLAGTFQEDADALSAWYSGWYNGLAKKHFIDLKRGKVVEHEVIMYCKANPEKKIIEALAVIFKDERIKDGVQMK